MLTKEQDVIVPAPTAAPRKKAGRPRLFDLGVHLQVTLTLSREAAEMLDRFCEFEKTTPTGIIRKALDQYLAGQK